MPDIELTRRALPALFSVAPFLWGALAALWMTLSIVVSAWIASRGAPPATAHWSERARARFPVSVTMFVLFLFSLSFPLVVLTRHLELVMGVSRVASILGGVVLAYAFIARPLTLRVLGRRGLAFPVDTAGVRLESFPTVLLFCAIAFAAWSLPVWVGLAVNTAVMFVYARWGFLSFLRVTRRLVPSARLEKIARPLLKEAALGDASASVYRSGSANALAFPHARMLCVTTVAMDHLDDEEIGAVLSHEIGHLRESAAVRWGRIIFITTLVPNIAAALVFLVRGSPALTFIPLAFAWVGIIGAKMLGKYAEKSADSHAIHTADHTVYARALEHIYSLNGVPAVLRGKGGIHGHLYDRLVATGTTPSFPRPLPPKRAISATLVGVFVLFGGYVGCILLADASLDGLSRVALGLANSREVQTLAAERYLAKDTDVAVALYRGLADKNPASSSYVDNLVLVLAVAGRCDEAWKAKAEAVNRQNDDLASFAGWESAEAAAAQQAEDALEKHCR